MARCQFCGRQFSNAQAVRAHLKACAAYQGRDQASGAALGSFASGTVPEADDPGVELIAEDAQHAGKTGAGGQRAGRKARKEVEEFLRRAEADQRTRRRRALLQSVKEQVVGYWSWQHPT